MRRNLLNWCNLVSITEGSRLMQISLLRISLLRFFKKIHKYLPYANFGLFYFISAIFWAKIAKNCTNEKKVAQNSHKAD